MPVMRTYQCPDCDGMFDHLHSRWDEPPPLVCPLCGASTEDTQPELSSPHIAKTIGKVADNVYRQMEAGAAVRAELADGPGLKLTDLRTSNNVGETSAVPVNNEITQFMARTSVGGAVDAQSGASYAAAAATGPFARGGMQTLTNLIKPNHAAVAHQVARNGNVGSDNRAAAL
jgi:hypothetical protein